MIGNNWMSNRPDFSGAKCALLSSRYLLAHSCTTSLSSQRYSLLARPRFLNDVPRHHIYATHFRLVDKRPSTVECIHLYNHTSGLLLIKQFDLLDAPASHRIHIACFPLATTDCLARRPVSHPCRHLYPASAFGLCSRRHHMVLLTLSLLAHSLRRTLGRIAKHSRFGPNDHPQ